MPCKAAVIGAGVLQESILSLIYKDIFSGETGNELQPKASNSHAFNFSIRFDTSN